MSSTTEDLYAFLNDGNRDILPASETTPAAGTETPPKKDPIPEDTESCIAWIRRQFPETSPRTSDPRVVDACIARAAIRDLADHMESCLEAAREDDKEIQ